MPAATQPLIDTQQFRRDGYYIARGLLAPHEAAAIRDAFMQLAANGPVPGLSEMQRPGTAPYAPGDPLAKYPRMMHPHLHPEYEAGRLARRYLLDARIGAILDELLEEEAVAVQSMFYFKPPGARGQALHQDNFYLRVAPKTCMAAWIAIDDADPVNGGMNVVPGTQDMPVVCPERADSTRYFTTEHVEPPAGKQEVPAILKAGDVLFFNGSVIHGSPPNTSKDRFRRALICHYVPISTRELSNWYQHPLRFDGSEIAIAAAAGGGPCGSLPEATSPH
jgi:hypothetical protein